MKSTVFGSQIYLLGGTNLTHLKSSNNTSKAAAMLAKSVKPPTKNPVKTRKYADKPIILKLTPINQNPSKTEHPLFSPNRHSRFLVIGAVSVGFVLFRMVIDGQKALALGPEGPLMEEFWDNVRRYAIYALTVSTGALYTIFQPIFELLKNPISAILILLIFGGSIYIISQVLSAMVGVTEFSYDYAY